MPFPAIGESETLEALNDPQPGDRFSEMLCFHLFVIHTTPLFVITVEGNAPGVFPYDGIKRLYSREGFYERFTYSGGTVAGLPWIRLLERGFNVEGWL